MITTTSRYTATDQLVDETDPDSFGKPFLEIRRPIKPSTYAGERGIPTTTGMKIENHAWEEYGDAKYWWAIAERNNVFNLRRDVRPAEILIIPHSKIFFGEYLK